MLGVGTDHGNIIVEETRCEDVPYVRVCACSGCMCKGVSFLSFEKQAAPVLCISAFV
jgi:hypothetical protein